MMTTVLFYYRGFYITEGEDVSAPYAPVGARRREREEEREGGGERGRRREREEEREGHYKQYYLQREMTAVL